MPDEADQPLHDADFARHKRFKQIARLLNNPKMRRAVDALKSQLRVISAVSLLCFIVSIIVIRVMGVQHANNISSCAPPTPSPSSPHMPAQSADAALQPTGPMSSRQALAHSLSIFSPVRPRSD